MGLIAGNVSSCGQLGVTVDEAASLKGWMKLPKSPWNDPREAGTNPRQ